MCPASHSLPCLHRQFLYSFYDFDQDHADGERAYLRESMYVTNFTSLLISKSTSLEYYFSNGLITTSGADAAMALFNDAIRPASLPGFTASVNPGEGPFYSGYRGGVLPVTTFEQWPWAEDRRLAVHRPRGWERDTWPPMATPPGYSSSWMAAMQEMYDYTALGGQAKYGEGGNGGYTVSAAGTKTVYTSGVILRSTEQGTGPPEYPKVAWIGCQDACQHGTTDGTIDGEVCNQKTMQCFDTGGWDACHAVDHRSNVPQWTGCGFRYANTNSFFGDPVLPELDNVACLLDCPRTEQMYDGELAALAVPPVRSCCLFVLIARPRCPPSCLVVLIVLCACCRLCLCASAAGNPTDYETAMNDRQQIDRSATFFFRNRQNFTVLYRTEIGSDVIAAMNANQPQNVRNDLTELNYATG
ncbi:hypothetical protein OAO87_00595, partial [bacterium]|nr:hypothetical protein [bacterium]